MKVSELCKPFTYTADSSETLADAAGRMQWHAVSALPVYTDHELVGILTERDLTAATADGVDPATARVADYTSEYPVTVGPGDDIAEAARRMLEIGVRHLPVVEGHRLVGIVSMRDLFVVETETLLGDR